MTENEAIKVINDKYETFFALSTTNVFDIAMATAIQALEEIQQYRAIGTIEEVKVLKEKSEPKKPIIHGLGQRYCPICKCGGADHFYCARCGQKLG